MNAAPAVAALMLAACVIPPSQSSAALVVGPDGCGGRASIGAHSAALDDRDGSPIDVGAGWVIDDAPGRAAAHGSYAALAARARGSLWLGGRAELYWRSPAGGPRRALVARIALRRFIGGVRAGSGDGGGAAGILGALATSLFVDVGVRQLDPGAGWFAAGGIALDLPAAAGVARR